MPRLTFIPGLSLLAPAAIFQYLSFQFMMKLQIRGNFHEEHLLMLMKMWVPREPLCDNMVGWVFEEGEPGEGGKGCYSDCLIPCPELPDWSCLQLHLGKWKEKETLSCIPCQHISNRTEFQGSLPAWLWQPPQTPPSMAESAALGEGKPVRSRTPTHTCIVDSSRAFGKQNVFLSTSRMEKSKDGI